MLLARPDMLPYWMIVYVNVIMIYLVCLNIWNIYITTKFIKQLLKKWFDTNADMILSLSQIGTTPPGPGLHSLQCHIRSIMLVIVKAQISAHSDDDHNEALLARQHKADRKYNILRKYFSITIWSTITV